MHIQQQADADAQLHEAPRVRTISSANVFDPLTGTTSTVTATVSVPAGEQPCPTGHAVGSAIDM